LDCQDSGKNNDKITSQRKTSRGNLSKIFSFEKADNRLKKPLFRFIKFLFWRGNFQLRKKSSGATFIESALIVALLVIAAIGGLGYLGLTVRDRLGILARVPEGGAAGAEGSGNETIDQDQEIKNAWDTFFEGLQNILDEGDGIENIPQEELKTLLENKFEILAGPLVASLEEMNIDLDQEFSEKEYQVWCFQGAILAKYGEAPTLLAYPAEFTPSGKYNEYMERLNSVYQSNETAFDKVAALIAVIRDIDEEPDDSPIRNNGYTFPSDEYENMHCGRYENDILDSYFKCYKYKAYHPEWEIPVPELY
jgi:Flp pilus assembly pilin Flp